MRTLYYFFFQCFLQNAQIQIFVGIKRLGQLSSLEFITIMHLVLVAPARLTKKWDCSAPIILNCTMFLINLWRNDLKSQWCHNNKWFSSTLLSNDFNAKLMFMLLGQFYLGKIKFTRHLLRCDYLEAQVHFLHVFFFFFIEKKKKIWVILGVV